MLENDAGEEQDKQDDEGAADERDIWEVAHVTEEDFETTEGETQDLYDKLQDLYDKLDGDGRVDSDGSRNPEKENDLT